VAGQAAGPAGLGQPRGELLYRAGPRLRRPAGVLAAVTCGMLAWAAAVPAAFVTPKPEPRLGGRPAAQVP
jgi:hypothetical protein